MPKSTRELVERCERYRGASTATLSGGEGLAAAPPGGDDLVAALPAASVVPLRAATSALRPGSRPQG
jgi:hypothetical protein